MHWLRRKQREQDLEREIRADLELEAEEQQEQGLSPEEARYAARRAFGNTTLVKEEVRAMWGWTSAESLFQDLRFGFRTLVRSPGITAAIVVSLALGLGATTALFSLLNSLLFKALPAPEPEQLVLLQHGVGADLDGAFTYPQFALMREQAKRAVDLFALSNGNSQLRFGGVDRKVQTEFVSGDFFRILRVQPFLGRLLEPSDDDRGSASSMSAVISYRLWRTAFQSDTSIIGRKILIDAVPFTVAGVTGRGFFGVEVGSYPNVWLSFASQAALSPESKMLECKGCYWLTMMGRLNPGYSRATAQAGLNVAWMNVRRATIPESMPERYKDRYFAERLALAPGATGHSSLRDRFTKPLYVLLAMTAVILLIACSNIANLLMARAVARRRELAVRLSIGARRGRLIRQLLTESALLAAAGLLASAAVYQFCVNGLLRFLQTGGATYFLDTTPDLRLGGFVTGLVLITLGLFGLIPAIRATRWRLSSTLAQTSQSIAARSSFGRAVLCGQLALLFSLLVAAILLARSLYDLRTFNAGFRRDHLLLISPDMSRSTPAARDRVRYTETLLSGIRNLPGVRSASASVVLPMSGSSWQRDFTTTGYMPERDSGYGCYMNLVSPDFFRTMGTRLLLGRDFSERDDETSPKAAVVNEAFVRRYWKDENPLGKQFHEVDKKDYITVVGVVEDAKYRDFRRAAPPTVYLPIRQVASMGWDLKLEVWTFSDPHSLIAPVRELLNRQLKDAPTTYQTFTELIDQRLLYERMLTALSVAFGALGVVICMVGIYGLAGYSVSRRTSEIGIRVALGATPGAVLGLIFREQIALLCAGLSVGAAGAFFLTRFLRTWLFGVSPTDAPSILAGMVCLVAITVIATSIPARRATRIHPMVALRHE
jgi:predicted permease